MVDVVLLGHFDTGFVDTSGYNHTLTPVGSVIVSGVNPKFGAGSANYVLGNAASSISTNNTSDFHFGSAPFTIEAWCYPIQSGSGDGYNPILAMWDSVLGNVSFFFNVFPHMMFFYSPDGTNYDYVDTATTPPLNAWSHVAVDRDASGLTRVYLNGAVVGSKATGLFSFYPSTYICQIGNDASASRAFPGYLDEVRVVRGTAMYGGTFTPPTAPFPDPVTGTTGTLNITQVAQTLSATGKVLANGTLGVIQANQVLAAAGGSVVRGLLSLTEIADTLSATGIIQALGITGILNLTEIADTLAATGSVEKPVIEALAVTGTSELYIMVPAESRILDVVGESRIMVVPMESHVIEVPEEYRYIEV